MANNIQNPGYTTILSATAGTTVVVGSWFEVNPHMNKLAFQAVMTASSVGATASSTVSIELSNDGVYPLATKGATFALTNTTTTYVSDGAALPSSLNGAWRYVRANLSSLTTSTAGSAGVPVVTVTVAASLI